MEYIHQRLIRLREEKGITVEEAALGLGEPPKTLIGWETKVMPRYSTMERLAKFYGVSMYYLKTGFKQEI
ncbi:MAG: helix-turn-helix transcriptional regulator [Candidatus Enteromonas sp.]|nr:helix-turn-helix transcriptional regulator [Candidatus Enteromonas sp.]